MIKACQVQPVLLAGYRMLGAAVLAFFWLTEAPDWSFYAASVVIVLGAAVALRATPRPRPADQL